LPGGPVGLASRWTATVNVEVRQTTYLVNRGRVGMEGSEGQSHKEEEMEGGSGTGEGRGVVPLRYLRHVPPRRFGDSG